MNVSSVKAAVTSKFHRQVLVGRKHSPTIMFATGVAGVVGTTVLACRATLKLEDVLDQVEESRASAQLALELAEENDLQYDEEDQKRDNVLITFRGIAAVGRLYAPSIALGAVSIALLTGSHVTLNRRNAATMAAYSALAKGFEDYRARVREDLGDEKDLEFRHGAGKVVETVMDEDDNPKTVTSTVLVPEGMPSIYARFFDEQSKSYSRMPGHNQAFLHASQNHMNDLLRLRGHLFLNEVYDALGLERSSPGAVVGWVLNGDGDGFVDFGLYDASNERKRAFINRDEHAVLLDFNVDGIIWDLIGDDNE